MKLLIAKHKIKQTSFFSYQINNVPNCEALSLLQTSQIKCNMYGNSTMQSDEILYLPVRDKRYCDLDDTAIFSNENYTYNQITPKKTGVSVPMQHYQGYSQIGGKSNKNKTEEEEYFHHLNPYTDLGYGFAEQEQKCALKIDYDVDDISSISSLDDWDDEERYENNTIMTERQIHNLSSDDKMFHFHCPFDYPSLQAASDQRGHELVAASNIKHTTNSLREEKCMSSNIFLSQDSCKNRRDVQVYTPNLASAILKSETSCIEVLKLIAKIRTSHQSSRDQIGYYK